MTTVYIWGQSDPTGHASVEIENGYLSFHPKDPELLNDLRGNLTMNPLDIDLTQRNDGVLAKLKSLSLEARRLLDGNGVPASLGSYVSDVASGQGLVSKIDINWLNQVKMQKQLSDFNDQIEAGTLKYQLRVSNCSTLSAGLLLTGAGSSKFDPHKSMKQIWDELNSNRSLFYKNNGRFVECVRDITGDVSLQCMMRGTLATPVSKLIATALLSTNLLTRSLAWTPGDVRVLADVLARHNR